MPSISQRMAQSEGRPIATRRPAATSPRRRPPSRQPFVPTTQGDWGGFLDAQAHKPGGTAARRQKRAPRRRRRRRRRLPQKLGPLRRRRKWQALLARRAFGRDDLGRARDATAAAASPERALGRVVGRFASERPYYHDPGSGRTRWDEPDAIDEHGSALFALSGKAVPPPPSEEAEEEAAPPARTLRRPSNPWQKKPAAPVVDSSSESSGGGE